MGFFDSSHGLRQGDRLSSFRFLFVMEDLSKMIEGLVECGLLYGFSAGNGRYGSIVVSHLLFTDNTLILWSKLWVDPIFKGFTLF